MPLWSLDWLRIPPDFFKRSRRRDSFKQQKKDLGVKGGRIHRRSPSPSLPGSKRIKRQIHRSKLPVVESIESDDDQANVPQRTSQAASPDEQQQNTLTTTSDKTAESDTESERSIDDEAQIGIDAKEKHDIDDGGVIEAGPHLDRSDPTLADWTDAEADLYDQLQDRGAEPMLPMSWQLDFPVLPDACFTTDDDQVVVYAKNGNNHHGIRALKALIDVGARARDILLQRHSPARVLFKATKTYLRWALQDAGLHKKDYDPVVCLRAQKKDEPVEDTVEATNAMMRELRERYVSEDGLRPVIFGIIFVNSTMTFVTLDSKKDVDEKSKALAMFDWRQSGQDVWNAMAVALLAMHARNTLLGISLSDMPNGQEGEDDPDA